MISRRFKRRILVYSVAFLSLFAFAYQLLHVTGVKDRVPDQSIFLRMKIPFFRNYTAATTTTRSFTTTTTTTTTTPVETLAPVVVKKLDEIYNQFNVSRNNTTSKLFPAYLIGDYLMLNPDLCRDAKLVDIIIIVHTAPNNFKKRQRMRLTFANRRFYFPKQVRIAFLLGKSKDKSIDEKLVLEHETYKDTVMGNFYDDYHNLTLKGVMGYHWVSEYCPNSKVVLKLDDDVIVDVYKLLTRYMRHIEGKQKSIFCNTWRKNMGIMRLGRWKVQNQYFSGLKTFPYFYCSGFTVLISTDLMKPLYLAARFTPFFWIDDLYLFGVLPKVVGGVTYYDYRLNKNISLDTGRVKNCWQEKGLDCSYFSTLVGDSQFDSLWHLIQSIHNVTIDWHVESVFEP